MSLKATNNYFKKSQSLLPVLLPTYQAYLSPFVASEIFSQLLPFFCM